MSERSSNSPYESSDEKMERFVALYAANQRQVHRYLSTLLPSQTDVDDLVQETSVVLWREFDQFQPGTNFPAWACRVAFNQVRAWRKRQNRDKLVFSEQFLEVISREIVENSVQFDQRDEAMQFCVGKLSSEHQKILKARYRNDQSIESLAKEFKRTTEAIYRLLSRIRHKLHDCIEKTISGGEVL